MARDSIARLFGFDRAALNIPAPSPIQIAPLDLVFSPYGSHLQLTGGSYLKGSMGLDRSNGVSGGVYCACQLDLMRD